MNSKYEKNHIRNYNKKNNKKIFCFALNVHDFFK